MRRYRTELAICLALVALTAAALGHACWNGFVNYDDNDYVYRNPNVKAGLSGAGFVWALTTTHAANWHPLTWLSLQFDSTLLGSDSARGYHLTNVGLHAANAVLLFLALRRMTGAVWRSAAVAALFAVHPAHVESVAWVAERKDVLSGFFWMLTMLAYAWYAERPGWARYLLVLTAFALGLMAKPMLVTLPCVLLLLDYWPLQRVASGQWLVASKDHPSLATSHWPLATLLLEKLPLFALTAAACWVTVYAQKKGGAVNTLEQLPLDERLINCLVAYTAYLGEMVWPFGLAPFYPHPHGRVLMEQALRAGLILAAITGLVLCTRRRRYLLVGWLWFLGTLVPVIGLVQVGSQAMADRYTYLPYIGLFLALTWGAADLLARWPARVRSVVALAALLIGLWAPFGFWLLRGVGAEIMDDRLIFYPVAALTAVALLGWCAGRRAGLWPARLSPLVPVVALLLGSCVALSAWQTRLWHNSIWLWEYTVAVTHDNPTAHNNLGDAYWNSTNPERIERARANFLATLRLNPRHSRAQNNLGLVCVELGLLDEAASHFQEAENLDPALFVAPLNHGIVLARQGDFRGAAEQQRQALRIEPNAALAHDQLGRALAGLGRWEDAVGAFRRAAVLEPKEKDFRADLAWALRHLGREDEAAREYAAITEADEKWPEKTRQLAWMMATDPNAARRNGFEAVRRAEQACQALPGCDALFLDTLGAAYAEAGCMARRSRSPAWPCRWLARTSPCRPPCGSACSDTWSVGRIAKQ